MRKRGSFEDTAEDGLDAVFGLMTLAADGFLWLLASLLYACFYPIGLVVRWFRRKKVQGRD